MTHDSRSMSGSPGSKEITDPQSVTQISISPNLEELGKNLLFGNMVQGLMNHTCTMNPEHVQ